MLIFKLWYLCVRGAGFAAPASLRRRAPRRRRRPDLSPLNPPSPPLYSCFFAASACINPFMPVFFRRAGLTPPQIGALAILRPMVTLPVGAAAAALADKTREHRAVLLATYVVGAAGRLALGAARGFPATLALASLGAVLSPASSLVDAAATASCAAAGEEYGRQRLWGAVGWGGFSLLSGAAISAVGGGFAFALAAAGFLVAAVPTALVPWGPLHAKLAAGGHAHGDDTPRGGASRADLAAEGAAAAAGPPPNAPPGAPPAPPAPPRLWRAARRLVADPEARRFFATAAAFGYSVGHIENFLFLTLEDRGGSATLMGATLTMTCVSETLVFWYAAAIIDKLGLDRCFDLCFAAFLLRLAAYATLPRWRAPWPVLAVEPLHGLSERCGRGRGCGFGLVLIQRGAFFCFFCTSIHLYGFKSSY
jgi:hypothetical protein